LYVLLNSIICNYKLYTSGPPTILPFDPVHYVIVGHSFILNCTATNDPQSPNKLTFRWFKDSGKIEMNKTKLLSINEHVINATTVTSQLLISDLQVKEHNGTYMCMVDNYRRSHYVLQNVAVAVESKYLQDFMQLYRLSTLLHVSSWMVLL